MGIKLDLESPLEGIGAAERPMSLDNLDGFYHKKRKLAQKARNKRNPPPFYYQVFLLDNFNIITRLHPCLLSQGDPWHR